MVWGTASYIIPFAIRTEVRTMLYFPNIIRFSGTPIGERRHGMLHCIKFIVVFVAKQTKIWMAQIFAFGSIKNGIILKQAFW